MKNILPGDVVYLNTSIYIRRGDICKTNKIVCFLNNTMQEISWISLYRDSFLISYRHPKFSILPSINLNYINLFPIEAQFIGL